jgi:glycosyltransferase involved in cell wall biosynthesis
MLYVFVNYNYSPDFHTPESWFKRTEGYSGLLEYLAKENTVISIKQINYEGDCTHNGVQFRFLDCGKKKTNFPLKLNRYVKSLNPDVVFVQGLHQPLQLLQLGLLLLKKTKIIAQHHAEQPFTGIKKYIQRLAGGYVNAYLFASHAMGMGWVKKGNISSAQKIYEVMEVSSNFYPIEKALAKTKTGINGKPVFLWVGRLNANKDPLNFVKAFLEFSVLEPSARLYMIYHTNELLAEVKHILNDTIHKDAITLVGKMPNEELLYWYNSADFIVSGSHYEGAGTAICEAMSCGCVPLVTDIFSFRMITNNGNCGILYEPGNPAALVSALMQTRDLDMLNEPLKSLKQFHNKLSFKAIATQIHQIALSL